MVPYSSELVASNLRHSIGFLLLLLVWLYPFYSGASADAMPQIVALGALALSASLFGLHPVRRHVVIVAAMFIVAILVTPNCYVGSQVVGIAGIILTVLGCAVGSKLRRSLSGLKWFLFGVVAAAFINALEGLLQWFGLANELWPWVVDTGRRGMAYGAFRQTNLFATFLCVGVVCTIWLVHLRSMSSTMAWILVFVMAFGIAASGSRTGGLELSALCLAGLVWRKQQATEITRLLVGAVFVFGLATWVLPIAAHLHGFGFVTGAERLAVANTDARLLIWQNATTMITERPWTGWGWMGMNYGHYVTLFDHRFNQLLDHAHNLPLQLAIEFGVPFTLVFLGLLAWAIYKGQPWRVVDHIHENSQAPSENRSFAWAILLMVVGVHSMLEKPLWYFGFLFLVGFAVGYLLKFSIERSLNEKYEVGMSPLYKTSSVILMVLAVVSWQQYADILHVYEAPFNDRDAQRAALVKADDSWLFRGYLDFIKIELREVISDNAPETKETSTNLLHFSAEPRVIQPLLLSLWYLQEKDALRFHTVRFCRAFPDQFERWRRFYEHHSILKDSGNLDSNCNPSDVLSNSITRSEESSLHATVN